MRQKSKLNLEGISMTIQKTVKQQEKKFAQWVYEIEESEIRRLLKYNPKYYFGGGKPGVLPIKTFHQILVEIIAEEQQQLVDSPSSALNNYNYGKTQGSDELREVLANRLKRKEDIDCSKEDVVITTGSQQMLYALNDVMINPGDIILTTRPTYLGFLMPAQKLGATIVTLPSDEEGLMPEYLETAISLCELELGRKPKMLYLVPYSDNPKGTTLPETRKKQILNTILPHKEILIVEDAAYKEIQFYGKKYSPLKKYDKENDRIAYLSTTTKEAASFRVGYSILPEDIRENIVKAKGFYDLCTSEFIQKVVAKYYEKHIDRQIPIIQKEYKKRRDAMVKSVDEFMPEGLYTKPTGGFFVWYENMNKEFNSKEFISDAIKAGVIYVPGYQFYPSNGYAINREKELQPFKAPTNTMRLGYSIMKPGDICIGIELLGKLIKEKLTSLRE